MDQCDSLITELITVLLDWYSGDINVIFPGKIKIKITSK